TVWVTPTGMKATTPLTSSSCKNTAPDGPGPGGPAARPPAPYSPRLGIEIEMVVTHAQTGASLPVDRYFQSLRAIKQDQGIASQDITLAGRCVGLQTDTAECGLDNGFNLLETALAPVNDGAAGLDRLATLAHRELADTLQALESDP